MKNDIEVKIHPETGEELRRGLRVVAIEYKGYKTKVSLPGWYPSKGNNGIHTNADLKVYDRALNKLKAQSEKLILPEAIRETRLKLKLTQVEAGNLIGGGPRAFQKYEHGDVLPSRAASNLLLLLSKKPEMLEILE